MSHIPHRTADDELFQNIRPQTDRNSGDKFIDTPPDGPPAHPDQSYAESDDDGHVGPHWERDALCDFNAIHAGHFQSTIIAKVVSPSPFAR